jgi:glucuronate isomerase
VSKPFIHDDFLLETRRARELYHSFAERLPIIDYHCHLSPKDIAEDRRFGNLTRVWLAGDHYKWRAMRAAGVAERFITGDASDREKFLKWAETVPKTLRNPLYHWTHLELARVFGITDRLLGSATAEAVWEECNAGLATPDFSARGILRRMNVEVVCTTDDPVDDLAYHKILADVPAETPAAFRAYVDALERAAGRDIRDFDDFLAALRARHDCFHAAGCRLSDHGLETLYADDCGEREVRGAFDALRAGKAVSAAAASGFKSAMLHEFAVMDWEKGWAQQFHLGALRNVNARLTKLIGPDTGFDSIGDFEIARPLARFLGRLDADGRLARTIVYSVNPRDNEVLATMIGNFQDGTVPGKMQFGAAWWFLDQLDGMTKQVEALSTMGLLSRFVGMLTDSRSFLSYPRHEYFRRLLCNILGRDMERGLVPDDTELVGGMVRDICHDNAERYFGFPGGRGAV